MSVRTELRSPALLWAVALGVLANALVRVPGRPGLNAALWALSGVVVIVVLLRRRAEPASRETRWLVGGALGFAGALMLRDAEALAVFSLVSAVLLLGLAAGRAASAWAARATVSDGMVAAVRLAVLCATGPVGWGRGAPNPAEGAARWTRQARTVAWGTVMALPALLVLTTLLMSADPVFARIVHDLGLIDIEPLMEDLIFTAVIAWLTAGYLRAFLVHDDKVTDRLRVPQSAFAAAEVSVALWFLNLLFVAFMAVQLRYLFGGADLVEVTAGLSYAEYARRGFFELVATAALVVPILLLADWAASSDTPRARVILRGTMLVLVVLLVGVIASAAYRMQLYQNAYGLTELRLYVSVFIVWLTAVLGWLVLTVLRGRRDRFVFGSIVAGVVCIAALHGLNPHAVIVRVNIARAAAGAEYDGRYLRTLSADAVPTLVARLDHLPKAERCHVAHMLEERWQGDRRGGWRTWNLSDWRARRLVRTEDAAHRRYLARCPEAEQPDSLRSVPSPASGD
ncbi:MAG: DUF4173 domain-containing protein [Acidobacteriota bacterium]|nr:DUF4173 domain-containing protein [Acidobacteriota bacterium]